ncbi:MAG: Hsp20 family protein [Hellea sp.]|nr:Hsp20 family protein [Hellea sp.]
MRTYDFSPLYRSFVGFDRMANLIDAASQASDNGSAYPPYNVAQIDDDNYRIELAVAGFSDDELEIESHENVLTITGRKDPSADNDDATTWLHRGIAERGFERRFQLADHVFVDGADLKNGLLVISLKRELPEALKPRKIKIGSQDDGKLIEQKSSRKQKAA